MTRIFSWALVLPLLKRLVPLKSLAHFMWVPPKGPREPQQEQKITTLVRWLYLFVFPENTCLERSLVLYRFLSGNNADPRLITGLRRSEDQRWKGHAWIEVEGRPFEESEASLENFQTFAIFGPDGTMHSVNPSA